MDPGTIVAITTASAQVLALITKYYLDVKNAKRDIERLHDEVAAFHHVFERVQKLAEGSNASQLPEIHSHLDTLKRCKADIQELKAKLGPGKRGKAMNQFGLRAVKWPLIKKDVEGYIEVFARHRKTIDSAFNLDEMKLVLDIHQDTNQLNRLHVDAELGRQLDKLRLSSVNGAAFNSYHRQHDPQCASDTRVELLRQLEEWSEYHRKCIFSLSGMAGTGKSTIARTIANRFSSQNRLGGSFFFSRGAGDLGHAAKFIITLAYQLTITIPPLTHLICEAIAKRNDITQQGLRNQWKELIVGPLSRLSTGSAQLSTLILVIDALDECDNEDDIKLILQLLVEIKDLSTLRLKAFVTSRPEIAIRLGFRDMPEMIHQDLVLHDIPRPIVEHDISVYLRRELEEIKKTRDLPMGWPDEKRFGLLVQRSDCLFIYAATACRFIKDQDWHPEEQLSLILQDDAVGESPTAQLDKMYTQILKHSVIRNRVGKEKERLSERFRRVVGSIVILFDVLSQVSLINLLALSAHQVELALSPLHSVLNIPKSQDVPIRLLHPSFRDFLVDPKRCLDDYFWINREVAHMNLTKNNLRLLCTALKRDVCNLKVPGALASEVQNDKINSHIPKHVQYACRYWVDHLEHLDPVQRIEVGLHDNGQVHDFFNKHFLHWLEVLSLLRNMSEGVLMVTRMEAMVRSDKNPALYAILHDAKRFILHNRAVIEKAPLQCYVSALIFSPRESIVKSRYCSQLPTWMKRLPVVDDYWNPALQTLEGHSDVVKALAFSSDGQVLASASDDQTVRLWDPKTGAVRHTLEGHSDFVNSVVFSSDGQLLASASFDRTVRLWDPKTGAVRHIHKGHSHGVRCVTFSSDGQLLASGSSDVQLWDPETGVVRHTLQGHSRKLVNAVVFSSDGQLLASASDDQTVRLWSPKTGAAQGMLEGHSDFVDAVAFSSDGQLVASASEDQTMRLWDSKTAAMRCMLEGHSGRVNAVLFSPDSQLLASASDDHTVRLWDPTTSVARDLLEGHSHSVRSATFSSDGQLLASAHSDGTVQLWDSKTVTVRHVLEGPSAKVDAVVFSSDGQLLATAHDQTVRLWDPKQGAVRHVLKDHSAKVNAVVFSSDGQLLASASDDQTVRLWDPKTGAVRHLLKGHSWEVTGLLFSSDNQLLVSSSSFDRTVWLWDPKTGAARATYKAHPNGFGEVYAMTFSSDGQLLAFGGQVGEVWLWDPKTGVVKRKFVSKSRKRKLEGEYGKVYAIAFSSDDQLLASVSATYAQDDPFVSVISSSGYVTVQLWDIKKGDLLHRFDDYDDVRELSFSVDGSYLQTNAGRLQLTTVSSNISGQVKRSNLWILKRTWLTWEDHNVLWIPPEFRPRHVANRGSTFAIVTTLGRLFFLELDPEGFS